jgi:alkylated DNA repair dioxygenase AlkB
MKIEVQSDLFESAGRIVIDTNFSSVQRTALDETSWVDVGSDWLSGSDVLFDQLARGVPWEQHYRTMYGKQFIEPRLTAEYRDLRHAPHPPLVAAAVALSSQYGVEDDSIWLNFYRDGGDSTGWHRDYESCKRPECIVPVLTLGTARRFLIKPRHGGQFVGFTPRSGDLVVMGGRCQEDWVHGVPKVRGSSGARISVNFQSSAQARVDMRTA